MLQSQGFTSMGLLLRKAEALSRQARRKYTLQVHAVLHGFLTSSDGAVSLYSNNEDENPHYTCHEGSSGDGWEMKNRIGILKQRKLWSISCRELDRIILERLFNLVEHDSDMVERIKAFWESRKTNEVDEGHVLKEQIKKAQEQIERLDKLLTNPARPLSKATEERYLTKLNDAEADLVAFTKEAGRAARARRTGKHHPQLLLCSCSFAHRIQEALYRRAEENDADCCQRGKT